MSSTLRRALLAALVATVAGLSLADGAFAQSKGNDGGRGDRGGISRGGGGGESGPDAAVDIYGVNKPISFVEERRPNRKRPPLARAGREKSCEVDGDLEIYNSSDRRKCNQPTKRIRQAYVSCETIYIAVPGGYVPERVCSRGE